MNIFIILAALITTYLIGSISFARIVTKLWSGKDVTEFEIPVLGTDESYKVLSIGANSVSSVLGPKAGMAVGILDILKIFLPTLIFKLLFPETPLYAMAAAVGGVMGHVWPLYYKFHGGSGFSAIMGGLLVIDPLAVIVTPIAGFILGMFIFRNLIVVSLSWLWLLIPWFWWRTSGDPTYIVYSIVINVIFILAMYPEIKVGMKYKKEGKTMEYGIGSLSSNPMGRGMLKMARSLGFMKEEIKKD
ncbi:MAG: glycerol-3-phosphate acyltransferase [Anaerolineales bacterium]|jgi:glycerol-3-phosphate acyltransferase PlsY